MIKGGVKNESEFFLCSFSHSKLCSFLFSFLKNLLLNLNFFRNFLFLRIFTGKNIRKIRFVCEQEQGKEKSHYISNTFSLALSFPLIL